MNFIKKIAASSKCKRINKGLVLRHTIISVLIVSPLSADPVRGLFAGINAGARYSIQNHDYTNSTGAVGKQKQGELATSFGISLGLLNQIEKTKAVVGGEVSASMNQSKINYTLQTDGGNPEGKLNIKNPYTFGGYGILGTMITPKLMLYAKAGWAWVSSTLQYSGLSENPSSSKYSKTINGPSGGAGANYLITNKIMIGGEYLIHVPTASTPRDNTIPINGVKRKFVYHPTVHAVNVCVKFLF